MQNAYAKIQIIVLNLILTKSLIMKIINSKLHGIIDYAFVLLLWFAPSVLVLDHKATLFSLILGCIHLALTLLTKFEFGVVKIIPFKIHGIIEIVVSVALIAVAFYLGRVENEISKYYFFSIAVAVFLTWLLTDYSSFQNTKRIK